MDQISQISPNVSKKHSPILCALSHLLIFGASYIYLRLYKRFFIVAVVMFLVGFFLSRFVPYLSYLVLLGVMIDTYMQTKGINDGTVQKEPFSNAKNVGAILLLLALIVASLLGAAST